jgi:DNA invertase Pin-like site-specific DNA recombinase
VDRAEVTDLARAARNLRAARQRLETAMQDAESAATAAHSDGTPETEIARTLGVNRMTVRRWLGKL